jgi:CRISPR-associated RAMP protein (TIGR02581 family)
MKEHLKILKEKVIIWGIVEPLTPLHIGWQRSFDPVESDAPVIKDPRGNPYIPGSSFKGILRGFIEGFLSGAGIKNCFPTDNEYCVDQKMWDDQKYILGNACPVCRIFGSSFMGSKLKIKDMPVKKEEWHETFLRIRDGIVIDRDSRTTRDGGKYDFETVSPGVLFQMEMVGDNLTDDEKGLLFTAFDLISQGFGALGGNVSRGTGRIKIEITEIESFKPKDFFEKYKKDKDDIEPDIMRDTKLKEYMDKTKHEFFEKYSSEVKDV